MTTYVASAGIVDVLSREDDALVLLPGTFHRLSALGVGALEACSTPATLDQIKSGLVARFGAPETGSVDDLVAAAVEELVTAGILEAVGAPSGR